MSLYADTLLVALMVINLYMVSTTRLDACIRVSILQAIVLATVPFALSGPGPGAALTEQLHFVVLAGATQIIKGIVIPWLLFRAMRVLATYREFEPFVSLHYSQFINGALCGLAFWGGAVLPWPMAQAHQLALGVALSTLLIGLYMVINRRRAISQILGYQVIESGLFVAGWALLKQPSLLMELGVLLDLLVAAMVMGLLATRVDTAADESTNSAAGGEP
jgi:hydrogenase-4 component E